jgi:hypothetical protein
MGVPDPSGKPTSEAAGNPARPQREWDVRSNEHRALEKARKLLSRSMQDHTLACLTAFPAIESFVKRNLTIGSQISRKPLMAGQIFSLAREQQLVNSRWGDTLFRWNRTRVNAKMELETLSKWDRAIVEEMIRDAPLLFQHIAGSRIAGQRVSTWSTPNPPNRPDKPRLAVPFTDPNRLKRIEALANIIQTGTPHPLTNKPVTSLHFDPDNFREEMIILQLHFLMRDVRFYINEDSRWSTSPIMARLSVQVLQYSHPGIRSNGRHSLQPVNGNYADALLDVLLEIVSNRYPNDCPAALFTVLDDATKVQNGNYPDGFNIRVQKSPPRKK